MIVIFDLAIEIYWDYIYLFTFVLLFIGQVSWVRPYIKLSCRSVILMFINTSIFFNHFMYCRILMKLSSKVIFPKITTHRCCANTSICSFRTLLSSSIGIFDYQPTFEYSILQCCSFGGWSITILVICFIFSFCNPSLLDFFLWSNFLLKHFFYDFL